MPITLAPEYVNQYRSSTFHTNPGQQLTSPEEAVSFVNERGFILFHPGKGVLLPSLWTAVAGDRPVPNEHDDPGHVSWSWKDSLIDQKVWYYGRLIDGRMSIVSLEILPYFYALSPNYGDWENDYLDQYEDGTLSFECKSIYEVLLANGPMNTLDLRESAKLWGAQSQYRFTKAMNQLQMELKILPVGIAAAGHWNYAFIFDILPRYLTEVDGAARAIGTKDARAKLLKLYLQSVGAASMAQMRKVFGWRPVEFDHTIAMLVSKQDLIPEAIITGQKEPVFVTPDLLL